MTGDHLAAILKQAQAKTDKDGWETVPEGTSLTLYLAHDGVPLNVNRISAMRFEGELIYARTAKREMYGLSRADLFAVGVEGSSNEPARRAGFG
jgi:hypothetical protein